VAPGGFSGSSLFRKTWGQLLPELNLLLSSGSCRDGEATRCFDCGHLTGLAIVRRIDQNRVVFQVDLVSSSWNQCTDRVEAIFGIEHTSRAVLYQDQQGLQASKRCFGVELTQANVRHHVPSCPQVDDGICRVRSEERRVGRE